MAMCIILFLCVIISSCVGAEMRQDLNATTKKIINIPLTSSALSCNDSSNCDFSEDCDPESKKCSCRSSVTNDHGICLIKAGEYCNVSYHTCIFHSNCTVTEDNNFINNSYVCKCSDGYSISNKGFCVHGWNQSCHYNYDCDPTLKCKNDRCACLFSSQIYSANGTNCFGTFGGKCRDNVSNLCEGDLKCMKNLSSNKYTCACPTGATIQLGNICKKDLGYANSPEIVLAVMILITSTLLAVFLWVGWQLYQANPITRSSNLETSSTRNLVQDELTDSAIAHTDVL